MDILKDIIKKQQNRKKPFVIIDWLFVNVTILFCLINFLKREEFIPYNYIGYCIAMSFLIKGIELYLEKDKNHLVFLLCSALLILVFSF